MRVNPRSFGQPLEIGASEWNAIAEAVAWVQAQRGSAQRRQKRDLRATVRVRNDTGTDLDAHSVVAIAAPLFTPTENIDEFEYDLTFSATLPDTDTRDQIAILLEPIADGEIGYAAAAGVAVCMLDVTDPGALYACEIPTDGEKLRTAPIGPARILWREGGSSGVEWAIVRIEGGTDGDFDAVVTDATALGTSPQSWIYDIKRGEVNTTTLVWTAASGAPALKACNKDEDTSAYQHGQSLSPAGATLTPSRVQGPVTARWTGKYYGGERLYTFSAPNPMSLTCP